MSNVISTSRLTGVTTILLRISLLTTERKFLPGLVFFLCLAWFAPCKNSPKACAAGVTSYAVRLGSSIPAQWCARLLQPSPFGLIDYRHQSSRLTG